MNFSIVCLLLAILATFAQADLATESFLLDLLEAGSKADSLSKDVLFDPLTEHTAEPTQEPTAVPTTGGTSASPTLDPTLSPTRTPTRNPTAKPTRTPTARPTTEEPTALPTPLPGDPTLAPTEAPTEVPTAVPTAIPTLAPSYMTSPILTFTSNITMGGIPTPQLDENSKEAVIYTTAQSMGIPTDTVYYLNGYSTAENRRRALRAGISLFTTSYSIKSETQVNIPLSAAGATNATLLYLQLTEALDASVEDGSFTTALKAASEMFNATELANVEVTGVSNSPPSVNNDLQYPPESDDALTGGEIAGIVIGVFVGVALLCALVYYFMFVREGSQKEAFQSNADVEISL